ncbi:hypothetical protein ARMGADRAFT_1022917 [Armillaria gallica]|uniref:Uncharacterized protein n=1 Tax=Armillaria gallica TaxID=47427 RepID=A0A2H3EEU8_ARMGA|nr:hypothetical protein ARMGADRAFT_1022917 [Armillaria gallica]
MTTTTRLLSVVSAALLTNPIVMGVDRTVQVGASNRSTFTPNEIHSAIRDTVTAYKTLYENELLDERLLLLLFRDEKIEELHSEVDRRVGIVSVSPAPRMIAIVSRARRWHWLVLEGRNASMEGISSIPPLIQREAAKNIGVISQHIRGIRKTDVNSNGARVPGTEKEDLDRMGR